jgi:hypothetical protein
MDDGRNAQWCGHHVSFFSESSKEKKHMPVFDVCVDQLRQAAAMLQLSELLFRERGPSVFDHVDACLLGTRLP